MIEENMAVYEALKNTALHCEDGIRNARIYMYTIYFTLLSLGFTYRWMFLVSFFVLIAFQTMINMDRVAVERVSSFIRIFFESKRNDMHWSLLNKDEDHLAAYRTQYQNIGWYINYAGASLLSVLSLLAMLITYLHDYNISEFPVTVWMELIIALLLCGLVIYINSRMYVSSVKHKDTIRVIDSSIEVFYNKCYTTCEKQGKEPCLGEAPEA